MTNENIEIRVSALEEEVKSIKESCKDINDRLIRMEENLKTNKDKIVDLEKNTQAIVEMSTNVRILTDKVSNMIEKLEKQEKRIEGIEDKPGQIAIKGWVFVATSLGTAIMGIITGFFMNGGI